LDSLITWIGGKKLLRKKIAALVPDDITGYVEPFGGAGWVLFHRDRWARLEVYNDLDSRLTNLFLQVKFHPDALVKELELMPASRSLFDALVEQTGLTELQRAARFLYVITRSFGGKGEHFGRASTSGPSSIQRKLERVHDLSKRLDKVTIEHLPYEELIDFYDRPGVFFYCDPPYVHGTTYATASLRSRAASGRAEGRERPLAAQLRRLPRGARAVRRSHIIPVSRVKGINRMQGESMFKEVIIANYEVTDE
jgi:DNA adenine methylase